MIGRTHVAGGVLAAEATWTASHGMTPQTMLLVGAAAVLGSILPDIDHPQSLIASSSLTSRVAATTVYAVTRHRGITHTTVFAGGISFLCWWLLTKYTAVLGAQQISYGLCAGMLSHLILDSLNEKGIMWLWPFSAKHISIGGIRTGSFVETIFRLILVVISGLWFLSFVPELAILFEH